jgi:hypothetical protein
MTAEPAFTNLPFPEALRDVLSRRTRLPTPARVGSGPLTERATLNALAARVGVTQSHLWRVVHRPDERRATPELIANVTRVLELPDDYFLETRARRVDQYLRMHPHRLNEIYAEAKRWSISPR